MMRKIDYKYFSKAKQIAQVSDFPKVHIGCIAVYQNRIVGIGCNTNKTHPAQKYYNRYRIDDADYNSSESLLPKLHAEINCLNQLYYDICQLDVMSGIEIDKAKKEFDVNNVKELDKLRQKYAPVLEHIEKDEEGRDVKKKKVPHFFSHISKQKGFYNPEKKYYCKYHTTMDYLQTIVNGFRIKNPYKKDWSPFTTLLDNEKYYSYNVNQNQIDKIYTMIKKYVNDRKLIYSSDSDSKEDKNERSNKLKVDLISDIESETIGYSTMYRLLSSVEDKENAQIKNLLLEILFLCGNKSGG